MTAFRLEEFGGSEVLKPCSVAVPFPGTGQVLVKIEASGVCGQDLMRRSGKVGQILGPIIGHEIAGTVAAVGPNTNGHQIGDRVASIQRQSCHRCRYCLNGQAVLCMQGSLYGEGLDGGYAEYCVVDELSLARIPSAVTFAAASIAACAIGTGYHALRLSDLKPGQRVLVTGASGGIGIHAVQLARLMGAEVVAVTSSPGKVDWLRLYADEVILAEDGAFDREIRKRQLQPHVVLDTTAHVTLNASLRSVQRGGTVAVVGTIENKMVEILPGALIIREVRLVGSKACSVAELEDCLRFLQRGLVEAKIHRVLPLRGARAAHDLLESGAVRGRVVLRPTGRCPASI